MQFPLIKQIVLRATLLGSIEPLWEHCSTHFRYACCTRGEARKISPKQTTFLQDDQSTYLWIIPDETAPECEAPLYSLTTHRSMEEEHNRDNTRARAINILPLKKTPHTVVSTCAYDARHCLTSTQYHVTKSKLSPFTLSRISSLLLPVLVARHSKCVFDSCHSSIRINFTYFRWPSTFVV